MSSSGDSAADNPTTVYYGPPRETEPRLENDVPLYERFNKELAEALRKRTEAIRRAREARTVKPEVVRKMDELNVERVNLHVRVNGLDHKTSAFHCTKGDKPRAVLRRGQEFKVTLTFNRPYQKAKDKLVIILDADDENPGKNLKVTIPVDAEATGDYRKEEKWGARVLPKKDETKNPNALKLAVYVPANCVVGEWQLKIKTKLAGQEKAVVYLHPQDIIILFNPWCTADGVYYPGFLEEGVSEADEDKAQKLKDEDRLLKLKEYVLNPSGTAYKGYHAYPSTVGWTYGQFEEGILEQCLAVLRRAFEFKMSSEMANPVVVARALSKIVNSTDERGVLVGNWSGEYKGGEKPGFWTSSADILRKYKETSEPVKFGQCWVFSHLLTAVCRALGLPCRSLTNYASAHDTDNTCTIDLYFNEDGDYAKGITNDSVWNFHVWNEVWILRPDLCRQGSYDGWQVIDATPQEMSYGSFQCGPCPVSAVKTGQINVGFDTGFVFSEVNADIVHWQVEADGTVDKISKTRPKAVGTRMTTKFPDGKPHKDRRTADTAFCLDLKDQYKFPEGSQEEREAVERAVRFAPHGCKIYKAPQDLKVWLAEDGVIEVGQDLLVTAGVQNMCQEEKVVDVTVSLRSCHYWDRSRGVNSLTQKKEKKLSLKPQEKKTYQLSVPPDKYLEKCDEEKGVFGYICARDLTRNMPYTDHESFTIRLPEIKLKVLGDSGEAGEFLAKPGQTINAEATVTNPFHDKPLTDMYWSMKGDLKLVATKISKGETKTINEFGNSIFMQCSHKSLAVGDSLVLKLELKAEVDPEDEERSLTKDLQFWCEELDVLRASFSVTVQQPQPPPTEDEEEKEDADTLVV